MKKTILSILKGAGKIALGATPGGAAVLAAANAILPKDKQLTGDTPADQAIKTIETLKSSDQRAIFEAEAEAEVEIEKQHTERYDLLVNGDGQETRARMADKAMNALIGLSSVFLAFVGTVYFRDGAELAFSVELVAFYGVLTATFAYTVRSYFGDLRSEAESRHQVADNKPRLPKGLAGVIQSIRG